MPVNYKSQINNSKCAMGIQNLQKSLIKELKRLIIPALTISTVYIFITLIYGNLLMKIGNLDQRTAFLSVIPGGVAEASVLAVSFDAVLAQVSAFQLLRYLSIVMIIPVLTKSIIIKIVAKPSIAPLKSIKIDESDLNVIHYSYIWLYLEIGRASWRGRV